MFKHLFKLIWNKKKQNFLFLSEILISFIVIFVIFTMVVYYWLNFEKSTGFKYKDVWSVAYSNPVQNSSNDSVMIFYDHFRKAIKSLPQVEEVAFSSANYPYSSSHSSTGFNQNGQNFAPINIYDTDDRYYATLDMKLTEGRWFRPEDGVGANRNAVINQSLKEALFGKEPALGKYFGGSEKGDEQWRVIGVIKDVKTEGDYLPSGKSFYKRMDTGSFKSNGTMLLKVSADADAAFEYKLSKILSGLLKNSNLEIQHLSEMRDSKNENTVIPLIVCLTVAGFLIINVALGLFGVLWYNISQRKGEIGLRRAIGASGNSISGQLVLESLLLASIALVAGSFFAIQFPLLNVFNIPSLVYLLALLLSVLFIYMLVIFCALYPGKQAASIRPAVALHEE